jgi:NAD(P)-dependent dehydrogenase (short-subunit alcohol dehydrogenase family)
VDPIDTFRLSGKVAFVSGGGGAIGSAIAVALGQAGAQIVVADKDDGRAGAAAARVRDAGAECISFGADITRESEADRIVAGTLDRYGHLDIIVNAVGGGAAEVLFDAETYPRDAWDWIMELNLRSTLVATQAAVRAMIAAGNGGKVLNISSVRAQLALRQGYSAYVAAKGAVSSLTRQWATEWAKHRINVNAIAPTFIDTPQAGMMLEKPGFKDSLLDRIPLARVGETSDLVGAAIFFVSPAASFVTGQILTIDGGLTATQ